MIDRGGNASAEAFPGWPRIKVDLVACASPCDDVKLSAVKAMAVLGEVGRLEVRASGAARILRTVAVGDGCWSDAGMSPNPGNDSAGH